MWRRIKGHGKSSEMNDLEGGIEEPSKETHSGKEQNLEPESNLAKEQLEVTEMSSKTSNSSKKKENRKTSYKDSTDTSKSQATATSKKSFWRARLKSSPTTRRSEEFHNHYKESSKKSKLL